MTQGHDRTPFDSISTQQQGPVQKPSYSSNSDFFSRENIKNVLIYSPVGICILNRTDISWANPAFYAMTSHECRSLEGRSIQALFPTDKEFNRVYDIVIAGIEQAGSATVDSRLLRVDETAFDCRLRVCRLDPGDHARGLLIMISDITEIKSGQIRKNQAGKMEAIGVLAGRISHDFNNLLMAFQGHLSLMGINTDRPEKIRYHIRQMNRLIEVAAELTGSLLGFARGGKYQVDTLDINQVVDMALTVLQPGKKGIVIERKPSPDLHKVSGDHSQLEQALLNLLVNACQAMVDGGTLTIETRNITIDDTCRFHFDVVPGPYVEISVQDTGIGMDESIQKKIFDPFFSTKTPGDVEIKGQGLGLSTVFGIVKNHGGFITVESKKNAGSMFRVALPAETPVDVQQPEEESDPSTPMPKTGETVLIVDDEDDVLEVGAILLEVLGYQALQARNGKQCLELLTQNPGKIVLVILDLIMPVMNGRETFYRIRELDPDIKILIFSGASMDEEVKRMLSDGCHGFLQKPFSMDRFSRAIREILDNHA